MNLENPYQPSQVAQFQETAMVVDDAWTPEEALGPRWLTVCKGAANCYTAVAIPVVSSLIAIGLLAMEYAFVFNFPPNTYSILGLGLLYAWVMQIVGLVRMGKTSRASGAKGWMIGALILCILYWIFSGAYVYATFTIENFLKSARADTTTPLPVLEAKLKSYQAYLFGYALAETITYVVYSVVLMLGIRRIGISLGNDAIRSSVMKSLWLFIGCVIVIPMTIYFLAASIFYKKYGAVEIGAGISSLVLIYIMLDFYGKALKKIADYAKTFAPIEPKTETA